MLGAVVTCVDLSTVPGAVPGVPCSATQGLFVVQVEMPEPGMPFDSVQASGFFFFGFGVIVFAYLLGFTVQQLRKPIRQGI